MAKPARLWDHGGKSRHERGYGSAWDKLRLVILARDSYLCQPCLATGRPTPAKEVDHIIPKAEGGTDDPENLQGICTPCHDTKSKAERARANGHKPKPTIGIDGWPMG